MPREQRHRQDQPGAHRLYASAVDADHDDYAADDHDHDDTVVAACWHAEGRRGWHEASEDAIRADDAGSGESAVHGITSR